MKTDPRETGNTSMSNELCSLKLRFLTLVITTADLINERATPTLTIAHALTAPIALFTTYIFLGSFVFGAMRQQSASWFIQIYAIVTCSSIQASLSIIVFRDLRTNTISNRNAAQILNGILPMLIILLLLADLIVIMFSNRPDISLPSLAAESRQTSQIDVHSSRAVGIRI